MEDKNRALRALVGDVGLMGAGEVCDTLGIKTSGLSPMRKRDPGFPAPLAQLKSGPVFSADEVRVYAAARSSKRRGA